MTENEIKQHEYADKRRIQAMKMGVDQSLHGLNNVAIFSHANFYPNDPRWKAVNEQATKALAEVMILLTHFELVVGPLHPKEDEE